MRTFIGLEFNTGLKSELISIQRKIKENSKRGTWVDKENFHMTLKFLGDIDESCVEQIDSVIKKCSRMYSPIKLNFGELGCFNNNNGQIRVLWLGVLGEVKELNKLYTEVDGEMSNIGFKRERRRFKPHITLGRRIVLNKPFNEVKNYIDKDLKYSFMLDRISLLKSEEVMQKRVYTPIKSYKLEGNHS